MNIEQTRNAIEESEKQGLDFIEIMVNAVPVPDGFTIVKLPKVEEPTV